MQAHKQATTEKVGETVRQQSAAAAANQAQLQTSLQASHPVPPSRQMVAGLILLHPTKRLPPPPQRPNSGSPCPAPGCLSAAGYAGMQHATADSERAAIKFF